MVQFVGEIWNYEEMKGHIGKRQHNRLCEKRMLAGINVQREVGEREIERKSEERITEHFPTRLHDRIKPLFLSEAAFNIVLAFDCSPL